MLLLTLRYCFCCCCHCHCRCLCVLGYSTTTSCNLAWPAMVTPAGVGAPLRDRSNLPERARQEGGRAGAGKQTPPRVVLRDPRFWDDRLKKRPRETEKMRGAVEQEENGQTEKLRINSMCDAKLRKLQTQWPA